MVKECDLVVLGGGPAGYPAAIRASQMGAKVCLVEKESLGGTCLNWGCISTKTLHGVAHLLQRVEGGRRLGVTGGGVETDPAGIFQYERRVVNELVSGVERLLKGKRVDVLRGEGRITAPGEVEVEGAGRVKGRALVIATGSSEQTLPGVEFDGSRILSSRDLLELGRIPSSLLIVGGGVIGCEFASIFNAFGAEVTIVEMLPRLISSEDVQVSRYLQTLFRKRGIGLYLSARLEEVHAGKGLVRARLDNGKEVSAEAVLISVGRVPNVNGIGLEGIGVEAGRTGIKVNNRMETGVRGVYAAGDVVGGPLLAHVATREGITAAGNALGGSASIDYVSIPSTIYTLPEVSHVGLTEEEAGKKGIETVVGRFPFSANGKAKALGEEEGFVKWIASKHDGRLIGLHIIGSQATELLSTGILAVEKGMTASDFTSCIYPHPTLSEALAEAADAVSGMSIHILG